MDLLPTIETPKGAMLVILRSFFDGGNKADSRMYENLCLAAVSATADEWGPFERDWREMLRRHHADYLHTTDAVSRENDFDGWKEDEVDSFLRDCARIATRHSVRLSTDYDPGQFGVYAFTVSIVLKDFVDFARNNPTLSQDANEGLIRQAIGDALVWGKDKASCDEIHCFFDQGEPFYGYLVNILESKRASKDAWLLKTIKSRTETSSREAPALQLADLFAWVECHWNDHWNPKWKQAIMRLPIWKERYDKSNLHDINHEHQAAWKTWKIPKRAATK
jgi:hypothetical protein